ncbi:MAG: hypothetical protein AAF224_08690 [Pseudomonadota bacterium]
MSEPLRLKRSDQVEPPLRLKRSDVIERDIVERDVADQAADADELALGDADRVDPSSIGAKALFRVLADDLQNQKTEEPAPSDDNARSTVAEPTPKAIEPLENEPLTGFSHSVAGREETPRAIEIAIRRIVSADALLRVEPEQGPRARRYFAVSAATGETLQEWSEATFFELVKGVREDVFADIDAEKIL